MSDGIRQSTTAQANVETPCLFMWRGHGIVLLGEFCDGRWILARGWVTGDALEHVRRWSFAAPGPFAGQVRRLVTEASHDQIAGRNESDRALVWISTVNATA
jgi:hypothetical protein